MQQAPQTLAVNTTQNLFINNHPIQMSTTTGGQAMYKDVDKGETVGPNGTASGSTTPSSAGMRLRTSRPKILFVMFIVFSLFTNMAWAQSTADNWNTILDGFPPENIRIVQDHIPQLCSQLVPTLGAVVNGESAEYRGVADIARQCLEIISLTNTVVQDPAIAFGIAFGNTLICNRIASAMFGGTATDVGQKLCNVVAVPVTSAGTTITSLAIVQSSAFPSGSIPTSAAFTSSGPTSNLPTTTAPAFLSSLASASESSVASMEQTSTGNATAPVRRRFEQRLVPLA